MHHVRNARETVSAGGFSLNAIGVASGSIAVASFQIQGAPSPSTTTWRMSSAPRRRASVAARVENWSALAKLAR